MALVRSFNWRDPVAVVNHVHVRKNSRFGDSLESGL